MKLYELMMLAESEGRRKFLVDRYLKKAVARLKQITQSNIDLNGWDRHDTDEQYEDTARNIIGHTLELDPTNNKIYAEWLLKQWLVDDAFGEDTDVIVMDLQTFDAIKARLPADKRDINKFDRRSLQALVEPYQREEMEKSKRQVDKEKDERIKKDVEVIYDGPEGSVKIPKTEEASCYLGRGTRWCTAATNHNMFRHYAHAPLYVFTFADGRKWQLHLGWEGMQFMDEQDHGIKLSVFSVEPLFRRVIPLIEKYLKSDEERVSYYCFLNPRHNAQVETFLVKNVVEYDLLDEAIAYATHVKHGHWPEMEHSLIHSSEGYYAFRYHDTVLGGRRWPKFENEFFKSFSFAEGQFMHEILAYNKKNMGSKRWPALEEAFNKEFKTQNWKYPTSVSLNEYCMQVSGKSRYDEDGIFDSEKMAFK